MSSLTIPGSILAQRGQTVTLVDESTVRLCYTFSSLIRIEEDFGTVMSAFAALQDGELGQMFHTISSLLAAGLEHESRADAQLGDTRTLTPWLDPQRFRDYNDAIMQGLTAAFPKALDEPEAGDGDADPHKDSRGESGTTSPQSPSDAPTETSGTP